MVTKLIVIERLDDGPRWVCKTRWIRSKGFGVEIFP